MRQSIALFHDDALGTRIPSLIGFVVCCFCVYRLVSRYARSGLRHSRDDVPAVHEDVVLRDGGTQHNSMLHRSGTEAQIPLNPGKWFESRTAAREMSAIAKCEFPASD
jgi:hypothetical protein